MKTLAKVELKNYRSHEYSVIEFGMLTSIIGENDAGKSNVYRAINMVLLNLPFSEAQLRYGTKEGSVKITFSDGSTIIRMRKGSKQSCQLFDTVKTTTYETIKDITSIVQDFTGFKQVILDKNSRPESIQLIPLNSPQSYLVDGTSTDGVLRRVNRLMSGAGIETARISLEKELRVLEKSNASLETELEKQQAIVDYLSRDEWEEFDECLKSTNERLLQLDNYEEVVAVITEFEPFLKQIDHLVTARDVFADSLNEVYALKEKIEKLEVVTNLNSLLFNAQKVIAENLGLLDKEYEQDDELKKRLQEVQDKINKATAEHLAQVAEEERIKALQDKKICPECKRPL
jgi:hypothetical protein